MVSTVTYSADLLSKTSAAYIAANKNIQDTLVPAITKTAAAAGGTVSSVVSTFSAPDRRRRDTAAAALVTLEIVLQTDTAPSTSALSDIGDNIAGDVETNGGLAPGQSVSVSSSVATVIVDIPETSSSKAMDKLKSILLIQIMSGQEIIPMEQMLPMLLLDAEYSDTNRYLMMTLMNVMDGEAKSSNGFNNNFNMLMPLLMQKCDGDDQCEKDKKDIGVILMAMQSVAPGSSVNSNSMAPLMMMDDKTDLLIFNDISEGQKKYNC